MLYRACKNEYGIPCGLRATKDEPVPNWCPMSVRKFVVIKAPHDPRIRGYTDPQENGAPGISAQWVWHIYQTAAQTDNLLRAMNYKPGRQALIYEGAISAEPSLVDRANKIFKRKLHRELKLTVNCHRVLNYSGQRMPMDGDGDGGGAKAAGLQMELKGKGELTRPKPDVFSFCARFPFLFPVCRDFLSVLIVATFSVELRSLALHLANGILNGNQNESKAPRIFPSLEDASRHTSPCCPCCSLLFWCCRCSCKEIYSFKAFYMALVLYECALRLKPI